MHRFPSSLTPIALAAAVVLLQPAGAMAQAAEAPAPAASASAPADAVAAPQRSDALSLERVVVTGTAVAASKMKQSVSVSTLEADQITNSGANSIAEILRSVPGVHTENSGGEGNANITVRGLPISAGGARYVQFQEDGLPVNIFGDLDFGTPDQFIRADYNVDHLEVIRGGSASTLASNAPGGVINFISKTGDTPGGAVGLTFGGLGGTQRRIDIDYGGKLGPRTYFHIGGFDRVGNGDRRTGFDAANGHQVKANITQNLDNGFIRLNFKALDDHTPTFLPVPVSVTNGHISRLPNIDPRTAFFISPSFGADRVLGQDGNFVNTNPNDGLHAVSTAVGAEAQFNLADGWTVNDKLRKTTTTGRFIGLFPTNNGDGPTPQTSTTFTGALFNTSLNDLGNTINDLKVSKAFGTTETGKATVTAGLFNSTQNVSETWYWNRYTVDMQNSGANAVFFGDGFGTFGGCCVRNFNVKYTNNAPYAALNYDIAGLTLDGSVRRDMQRANGYAESGDAATQTFDAANAQKVHYSVAHTSYSVGANYALNKDLAGFARVSDGVSFNGDRILYGTPLDGTAPIFINLVKQIEGGVKYRTGGFNLFATLFRAKTSESNYEATSQTFSANKYNAKGLELEAGYQQGIFRLGGGATFTHSRIVGALSPAIVGKTPRRVAKAVFNLAPSVVLGDAEVGAAVSYTGKSFGDDANTIDLPSYTTVNAFLNYQINDRTQASLTVNNLTNQIGYTEVEGDGHAARSINGRTAKVGVKYTF